MLQKSVLMIMVMTLLSKVLGFSRDIFLAYFYGATSISDIYLISLVIPSVIFGFIGTGLYSTFIPMYSNIESKNGNKEGERFTNNVINLFVILSTGIFLVCVVFTEPLVKIFASGFHGDTLETAMLFTRITSISMFFTGIIYIFSGYLELKGKYLISTLMGIPFNMVLILGIVLSSMVSIYYLPFGKVVGTALQFLFLLFFMFKKGFVYKPLINLKDKNIKRLIILAFPIILSSSVEQLNKLVDRTIASNIAVGGISALNYANQLNLFVQSIFVTSITVVFYPIISKMAANHNLEGLKRTLSQTIVIISAVLIPATIGILVLAEPLIDVLFGRGAFTKQAMTMTSSALFCYSLGMVSFGLREVLTKVFYAIQDTKTPTKNSILAITINIVLNIILSKPFGIAGLALATSISGIIVTSLLFIHLQKRVGFYDMKDTLNSIMKILFISLLMGLLVKIFFSLMGDINIYFSISCSIIFGGLNYASFLYFMKIKAIDRFILDVRKKAKRG